MASLLNRARMSTATTGTGTVTLGSAIAGYASFAEAGAANGALYSYCIEDGADFEIGTGSYTSAGPTFSRDTVTLSKVGGTAGTAKINLSGNASIFITARAEDFELPFDAISNVEAADIPASVAFIRTAGYSAAGDGGGALYRRVVSEPTHAGKIHSADGAWWEIVFPAEGLSVKCFGAVGDGSTDDTIAIQSAIDAGGSGVTVLVPDSTFRADGLSLNGTSGTLSNVTLIIMAGGRIRARNAATNNVVEAMSGSGCRVVGPGRISGSKDTGGTPVRPPTRGFWTAATSYALNDTVEVSSSDVATTTVAASNLVYRCISAHTSSAAFLTDKATRWTLVSDANFNTADLSYRYRNGVYLGAGAGHEVVGVEIDQCVYAGVNLGSGPVQTANLGGPLQRGSVRNNYIHDCENGLAGGNWQVCEVVDNDFSALDVYGIVSDIQTASNIISRNTLVGKTASVNAIYCYDGESANIDGNTITGSWTNGIVADVSSHYTSITGNRVTGAGNMGIFVRNSLACKITDNTANGCGAHGIEVNTVTGATVQGNVSYGNASAGIRLTSSSGVSVVGNETVANVGPGLDSSDSSGSVFVGNTSRGNSHGIRSTGTSTGLVIGSNDLNGNATAQSLVGTNVTSSNIGALLGASHLGSAVSAPTSPAGFSAQTIITVRDNTGTLRYVPAMNTTW